ncbi:hypothetical protein PC128_g14347 [Phytophthora cactorum]|nr:hypothetical protein PC128_g14347 [Phytophthora cactorum]
MRIYSIVLLFFTASLPASFLRTYDPADVDDEERAGVVDAIKAGAANLAESAKLRIFLSKKKSGVDVLNSLKFGDNVADALVSSKVESLKKYIAMFNQKNPDEAISLIGTFTARYGDDAVAKALVSAERRGGSKVAELAKQLRAEQLSFWLDSDKSVDDVFKLLKLSSDGYKALGSRKLIILDDYIKKFYNAKHVQETMLQTLTKGFGGESNLVTILAIAQEYPRTKRLAELFEGELLRQWRGENAKPIRVMELLLLDAGVETVLKCRNWDVLERYIPMFNDRNPDSKVTLLDMLTSKYGDAELATAIVSARKPENMEMFEVKFYDQNLDGWLKNDKSVDDVFKLLKFKNDWTAFFSPHLNTLSDYIILYNHNKKGQETLVGALAKGFGETQLAEMLLRVSTLPGMKIKVASLQRHNSGSGRAKVWIRIPFSPKYSM